jgi:hypothetical protein
MYYCEISGGLFPVDRGKNPILQTDCRSVRHFVFVNYKSQQIA